MDNNTLYFNDQEGGMMAATKGMVRSGMERADRAMEVAGKVADRAKEVAIEAFEGIFMENSIIKDFIKSLEDAKKNPEELSEKLSEIIESMERKFNDALNSDQIKKALDNNGLSKEIIT